MKVITVGQLRQNPTAALDEVERGETYRITRHNREIGRIVPAASDAIIEPPRRRGPARTVELDRIELRTASSISELLDEMKGEW